MEIAESYSQKAFKQTSPAMNSQSHVLARGWLEDLKRSHPSLSSVNVINKIHSYLLQESFSRSREKAESIKILLSDLKWRL